MQWWAAGLAVLLYNGQALGWTVKGTAEEEARVRAAAWKVPACTQETIERGLDEVIVVPPHRLDRKGMRIDATSFRHTKHTYIDRSVLSDESVITHEMGHFYDWKNHESDHALFKVSLDADFADMSELQRTRNHYLQIPEEAYAELFALRAVGPDYYFRLRHHYDLELLHRSYHVLEATLCHEHD